jgi:hypothetical protein
MLARVLQLIRKDADRPLSTSDVDKRIEQLYKQKKYLAAYSEHTNIRVELNPHLAVGGMWEEIGKLQLDFLVNQGLRPTHKFLDIGCGTLRGGRHFIRYLDAGNYAGRGNSVLDIVSILRNQINSPQETVHFPDSWRMVKGPLVEKTLLQRDRRDRAGGVHASVTAHRVVAQRVENCGASGAARLNEPKGVVSRRGMRDAHRRHSA